MGKMVVVYATSADPAGFDAHYFGVHVPLAKQLPGLRRYEVSRGAVTGRMSGDAPYMVATLTFDTLADLRAAFASDVGRACADDRRRFAPDDADSTLYLFEDEIL